MGTIPVTSDRSARTEVFSASRSLQPTIVQPTLTALDAPPWVDQVAQRVDELAILGANWDGRYSDAVSCDVLYFAWSVLSTVMRPKTPPPALVALSNGGLQMIWAAGDTEIEVEIIRPNEVVIFACDAEDQDGQEWPASTDFRRLASALRKAFH